MVQDLLDQVVVQLAKGPAFATRAAVGRDAEVAGGGGSPVLDKVGRKMSRWGRAWAVRVAVPATATGVGAIVAGGGEDKRVER